MADPVALQIQTPNAMTTLGNVMNFATQAQALKKAQATYGADVAQRNAESRVAVESAGPRITQEQQAAKTAEIGTSAARYKLDEAQTQKAMEIASGLVQDPAIVNGDSEGAVNALLEAKKRMLAYGIPESKAEVQLAPLMTMAGHNPKALQQTLKNIIVGGQSATAQASTIQPSGPVMQSGQVSQQINTNPFSTQPQGAPVSGTTTQQELPPTTPIFNPADKTPGYLGPTRKPLPANVPESDRAAYEAVASGAVKSATPIQSGPALGARESIGGTVEAVNKDWTATAEAAKTASADIANLQNIKRFASSAQTGVGSERRAFVAGLAGLIGIDYGEMTKTKTDLLAKNANMLALAGGDTNLAKTLAESANPNTHMTKEAILEAANQVMSQRRMALAKQEFLQPHKVLDSPDSYSKALTEWNKVADPRIFQWPHMSAEEKINMKSSMTGKEQAEFRNKIQRAIELGIVK